VTEERDDERQPNCRFGSGHGHDEERDDLTVEVAGPAVERFAASVKRTATPDNEEGEVVIESVPGAPREAARRNKLEARTGPDASKRPFRKAPHRAPGGAPPSRAPRPYKGAKKPQR